jgi:hypothetical protein
MERAAELCLPEAASRSKPFDDSIRRDKQVALLTSNWSVSVGNPRDHSRRKRPCQASGIRAEAGQVLSFPLFPNQAKPNSHQRLKL